MMNENPLPLVFVDYAGISLSSDNIYFINSMAYNVDFISCESQWKNYVGRHLVSFVPMSNGYPSFVYDETTYGEAPRINILRIKNKK